MKTSTQSIIITIVVTLKYNNKSDYKNETFTIYTIFIHKQLWNLVGITFNNRLRIVIKKKFKYYFKHVIYKNIKSLINWPFR